MKTAARFRTRPAEPEDLLTVCAMPADRREAFWIFPAHSYPIRPAELARNLEKRFDPTVAEMRGKVAGFANLYRVVEGESCFVGNLTVASDQRRKGLGAALLAEMARMARQSYCVRDIRVSCFHDNLNGLFFYHGQGFAPYAMEPLLDWDRKPVALFHMHAAVDDLIGPE